MLVTTDSSKTMIPEVHGGSCQHWHLLNVLIDHTIWIGQLSQLKEIAWTSEYSIIACGSA